MAAYRRVNDSHHLQADWDQLRDPTLGNRVGYALPLLFYILVACADRWSVYRTRPSTTTRHRRYRNRGRVSSAPQARLRSVGEERGVRGGRRARPRGGKVPRAGGRRSRQPRRQQQCQRSGVRTRGR